MKSFCQTEIWDRDLRLMHRMRKSKRDFLNDTRALPRSIQVMRESIVIRVSYFHRITMTFPMLSAVRKKPAGVWTVIGRWRSLAPSRGEILNSIFPAFVFVLMIVVSAHRRGAVPC